MYTFEYEGDTLIINSILAKKVSSKAPRCSYLCKNVVATYVEEDGKKIVKSIIVSNVETYLSENIRKRVNGGWTVIDFIKNTSHELLKEAVVKKLGDCIHLFTDKRSGEVWRLCLENDVYCNCTNIQC